MRKTKKLWMYKHLFKKKKKKGISYEGCEYALPNAKEKQETLINSGSG